MYDTNGVPYKTLNRKRGHPTEQKIQILEGDTGQMLTQNGERTSIKIYSTCLNARKTIQCTFFYYINNDTMYYNQNLMFVNVFT